jgi:outer membrane protein assembly factor BamB
MSEKKSWVLGSDNHGRTYWASKVSGLPSIKPKWQLLKCAKYGVGWDVCITDKEIFLCSAELLAVAIDVNTGKQIWETIFPEEATYDIAINDKEVLVSPYVLDRVNGKIIEDLSNIENISVVADVANNIFYCYLASPTQGILRLDEKRNVFFVDIDLLMIHEKSNLVIGKRNHRIFCSEWGSSTQLWEISVPLAKNGKRMLPSSVFMLIDDMVYVHMCKDTLLKISVYTGEIVWQSGPSEIEENETPYQCNPPQRFLGCSDALYLCAEIEDEGYLQARSTEDGRELWRVDTPQARAFLIAGDLLFGALDDLPVAWDRHSGEVVWQADKKMTAIYHAVSAANKVVYTNTMSQMRCYEWTEPYHSPVR